MSKIYSNQDVQDILREATMMQKDGSISAEQLQEIAAEVGISAIILQKAEQAWLDRQAAKQKQAKKRIEFRLHLIPYLAVSLFLIMLNLATTPQDFWSIYPILGWGLGVTLHGTCIYQEGIHKEP